jgi:hypothetical protein
MAGTGKNKPKMSRYKSFETEGIGLDLKYSLGFKLEKRVHGRHRENKPKMSHLLGLGFKTFKKSTCAWFNFFSITAFRGIVGSV